MYLNLQIFFSIKDSIATMKFKAFAMFFTKKPAYHGLYKIYLILNFDKKLL